MQSKCYNVKYQTLGATEIPLMPTHVYVFPAKLYSISKCELIMLIVGLEFDMFIMTIDLFIYMFN